MSGTVRCWNCGMLPRQQEGERHAVLEHLPTPDGDGNVAKFVCYVPMLCDNPAAGVRLEDVRIDEVAE